MSISTCTKRWLPVAVVFAIYATADFALAQDFDWQAIGPMPLRGPTQGRVSAVAPSPDNADVFYIGSASGGVWRYSGDRWTSLTDHLPTGVIGAVAVAPSNGKIIYAGSGEANYAHHSLYGLGLFKSIDGGENWEVLAEESFSGRTFSKIKISNSDPNLVYASIMHAGGFPAKVAAKNHPKANDPVGVYRSTDGGKNWEHLKSGIPNVAASDLALHPSDDQVIYAAIGDPFGNDKNGIYKSTDGGDSWALMGSGIPSGLGRISLALAPSMPDRIYAFITNPSNASGGGASTKGVYRSDDGGTSWSKTNAGTDIQATYGWYLSTAVVHPKDPDIAVFGGFNAVRTTNGGTSFTDVTPPHVDLHALVYDANDRLLSGDDGGLHRSTNNGSAWDRLNRGELNITQSYAGISFRHDKKNWAITGFQDNGTALWNDNDFTWNGVQGGDGGPTAMHPDQSQIIFVQSQQMAIYRSTNGGSSFSALSGVSGKNAFFSPIVFAPSDPSIVYLGTEAIWYSSNAGSSWKSGARLGSPVRALAVAPSDSNRIYAATIRGELHTSQNGGKNFDKVLEDLDGFQRTTRELAVSPLDPDIAYVAVSSFGVSQVRRTDDGGKSWTEIDGNLPDIPANTIDAAKAQTTSGVLLVLGTDQAVYLSCDEGKVWRRLDGLPVTWVSDVRIDSENQRILIATFGRGAWTLDIPALSGPDSACGPGDDDDDDDDDDNDDDSDSESSDDSESDTGSESSDDDSGDENSDDSEETDDAEDSDGDSQSAEAGDDDDSDQSEDDDENEDDAGEDGSENSTDEDNGESSDTDSNSDSDTNSSDTSGGCTCSSTTSANHSLQWMMLLGLGTILCHSPRRYRGYVHSNRANHMIPDLKR